MARFVYDILDYIEDLSTHGPDFLVVELKGDIDFAAVMKSLRVHVQNCCGWLHQFRHMYFLTDTGVVAGFAGDKLALQVISEYFSDTGEVKYCGRGSKRFATCLNRLRMAHVDIPKVKCHGGSRMGKRRPKGVVGGVNG